MCLIEVLVLIGHISLRGTWLRVASRMDSKKTHVREIELCAKNMITILDSLHHTIPVSACDTNS